MIKINGKADYHKVTKDNGASIYCLKENTRIDGPWEFGKLPVKRNDQKDWDKIKQLAKDGNLDEIPSDILIRFYPNLKAIARDNMVLPSRVTPKTCLWYWGASGTGKSSTAIKDYPESYMKMTNKWWDGY